MKDVLPPRQNELNQLVSDHIHLGQPAPALPPEVRKGGLPRSLCEAILEGRKEKDAPFYAGR